MGIDIRVDSKRGMGIEILDIISFIPPLCFDAVWSRPQSHYVRKIIGAQSLATNYGGPVCNQYNKTTKESIETVVQGHC